MNKIGVAMFEFAPEFGSVANAVGIHPDLWVLDPGASSPNGEHLFCALGQFCGKVAIYSLSRFNVAHLRARRIASIVAGLRQSANKYSRLGQRMVVKAQYVLSS